MPSQATRSKAADFKGKAFDINEKGEIAIPPPTCEAGKGSYGHYEWRKETDVHLFIYSEDKKKEVGKDTSPGPRSGEVKFTPSTGGLNSSSWFAIGGPAQNKVNSRSQKLPK